MSGNELSPEEIRLAANWSWQRATGLSFGGNPAAPAARAIYRKAQARDRVARADIQRNEIEAGVLSMAKNGPVGELDIARRFDITPIEAARCLTAMLERGQLSHRQRKAPLSTARLAIGINPLIDTLALKKHAEHAKKLAKRKAREAYAQFQREPSEQDRELCLEPATPVDSSSLIADLGLVFEAATIKAKRLPAGEAPNKAQYANLQIAATVDKKTSCSKKRSGTDIERKQLTMDVIKLLVVKHGLRPGRRATHNVTLREFAWKVEQTRDRIACSLNERWKPATGLSTVNLGTMIDELRTTDADFRAQLDAPGLSKADVQIFLKKKSISLEEAMPGA